MKFIKPLKTSLFLITFVTIISSCSHGPAIQAIPDTASPSEEVKNLRSDIDNGITKQMDVLSPGHFRKAEESLADAQSKLDRQKDSKAVLQNVAEGRAHLKEAQAVATVAHQNIPDVISAREKAIVAGAKGFPQFKDTDKELKDATADLEKNNSKNAVKNRTKLQTRYLDLELGGIKQTHLGDARETIAKAKKEGAQEFAPQSLAQAEKSLKDSDAYITANRTETAKIKEQSIITTASANHLMKITRDAKAGNKSSPEELALQLDREQKAVAAKQAEIEDKQSEMKIKQAEVAAKQSELDTKEGELTAEKLNAGVLTAQKQKLQAEQDFNRLFDEAQAQFSKDEAEVYKQGESLVIRLRSLEFPKSQAVLKGSNFPLLSKVTKVIEGFGPSKVVVEGHTDSQGGKALNQRLSTERAEAIEKYLISNDTVGKINISSVGYDYQKPLATNKTVAGRAQNRRVDIVISPER